VGFRFFEGPEKKVELVVVDGHSSLRAQGEERWEGVVRAARAQVISKRSTEIFDAYLLSESSLFVYDEHFTMITCGQTRLVDAVEEALEVIPVEAVAFLALERKNENFPREQPTCFEEDARRLARLLPGQALRFGDQHDHCIQLFHTTRPFEPDPEDTTLEVLMHGIADRGRAFRGDGDGTLDRARSMGVGEILSGFEIDDHLFTPAGYSLNGLKDELYYTLHVTPQEVGSYVSFETNFDFRAEPASLVREVVEIFRPESFDVFAFVPERASLEIEVPGYLLRKYVYEPVSGYGVSFLYFYRPPEGPAPPSRIPLA
jgi:S-adenosylmethionine decarboxylase